LTLNIILPALDQVDRKERSSMRKEKEGKWTMAMIGDAGDHIRYHYTAKTNGSLDDKNDGKESMSTVS
jgi:hypothetical protein